MPKTKDYEVQTEPEAPTTPEIARLQERAKTGKRRWITRHLNQLLMEPCKERRRRDPDTGDVTREYIRKDDSVISEIDIRTVQFRPMHLAFPCGFREFEYRSVGVCETDDPEEIKLIEAEEKAALSRNEPHDMQEYPFEEEIRCMQSAKCTGHLDHKLRQAEIELQE